jgi:hypothetical protein
MARLRWILVGGCAVVLACGWAISSCAVDDDITWITDESCTVGCRASDEAGYSCDVDSSCTPVPGCTDWDCNERPPGGDGDGPTAFGDGGIEDDGQGNPLAAEGCVPAGGSYDRDSARPLTLGVRLEDLWSCPDASGWFRFDVPAGARFVVDLQPAADSPVSFVLYAGDDATPVASADMNAPGRFAAFSATDASYVLRVRAFVPDPPAAAVPASYSLAVFLYN